MFLISAEVLWGCKTEASAQKEYKEAFKLTFSCHFEMAEFPFDLQNCSLIYCSGEGQMNLTTAVIAYARRTTKNGSIILQNLPFAFDITLDSVESFEVELPAIQEIASATGLSMKLDRKAPHFLWSSFYLQTTVFSLLLQAEWVSC